MSCVVAGWGVGSGGTGGGAEIRECRGEPGASARGRLSRRSRCRPAHSPSLMHRCGTATLSLPSMLVRARRTTDRLRCARPQLLAAAERALLLHAVGAGLLGFHGGGSDALPSGRAQDRAQAREDIAVRAASGPCPALLGSLPAALTRSPPGRPQAEDLRPRP